MSALIRSLSLCLRRTVSPKALLLQNHHHQRHGANNKYMNTYSHSGNGVTWLVYLFLVDDDWSHYLTLIIY